MKPLYIIPAIGEFHAKLAGIFIHSAKAFGWDVRFRVLTDVWPDDPADFDLCIVKSECPRAKDIKSSFYYFVPLDYNGPVVLADADLLATGPLPQFHPNMISAVPVALTGALWDTFLVSFPNASIAREVGQRWHAEWLLEKDKSSPDWGDVPSFNEAVSMMPVHCISEDRTWPLPSLVHYQAGKIKQKHLT
jgi:hypothetical protein